MTPRKRRTMTPEQLRQDELIGELIKLRGMTTADDAQNFVKEILGGTIQKMLVAELDNKLGYSKYDYRNKVMQDCQNDDLNSRNGYSKKTIKTSQGEIELDIPRDRNGEFEPVIVGRHQTHLDSSIEDRILGMYGKGMSTRDISDCVRESYGFEVCESMVSQITNKILPVIKDWQARPLQEIYAVFVPRRCSLQCAILKKAVYWKVL
jgi:transposase-like protein